MSARNVLMQLIPLKQLQFYLICSTNIAAKETGHQSGILINKGINTNLCFDVETFINFCMFADVMTNKKAIKLCKTNWVSGYNL